VSSKQSRHAGKNSSPIKKKNNQKLKKKRVTLTATWAAACGFGKISFGAAEMNCVMMVVIVRFF
jgi:hypothetical protein